MRSSFAETWIATRGEPIEFNGRTVVQSFTRQLVGGSRVMLNILNHKAEPLQAVRLTVNGGALAIEGLATGPLKDVSMWTDTAPASTTFIYSGAPTTFRVWNAWRGPPPHNTMHAWLNDAGVVIQEESPHRVVLGCSDGVGEPDFEDLVIELLFDVGNCLTT